MDPNDKQLNAQLINHILDEFETAIAKITARLDDLDRRYVLKTELNSQVVLISRDIKEINSRIELLNEKTSKQIIGTGIGAAAVTSVIVALITHIVESLI